MESKHVCKFCSKGFGCGRSLGGHMRSHMINDISSLADGTTLTRKKLPPLSTYLLSNPNHNPINSNNNKKKKKNKEDVSNIGLGGGTPCYVLREKPKRTRKFSGLHSIEESNTNNSNSFHVDQSCKKEVEEQDSSTIANNNNKSNHNLIMDSQSDNKTAAPSRRKRSQRRTSYTGNANSSYLSIPNNASSSLSGIEQDQEEAALCLIMLSKNVGQWAENKITEGKNEAKLDDDTKLGTKLVKEYGLDEDELDAGEYKNLSKRKSIDSFDPEMKLDYGSSEFECTTGNKVFCSNHALGGHRASHKKGRGCSGYKLDSDENSIEMEESTKQVLLDCNKLTSDKLINEIPTEQLATDGKNKAEASSGTNKSTVHECPICFKVFQSGQALGGHKRAYIVGVTEAKTKQAVDAQEPIPTIRDGLDLNLPAPIEEDSNGIVGFNPWWIPSSHSQEPLLRVISN